MSGISKLFSIFLVFQNQRVSIFPFLKYLENRVFIAFFFTVERQSNSGVQFVVDHPAGLDSGIRQILQRFFYREQQWMDNPIDG